MTMIDRSEAQKRTMATIENNNICREYLDDIEERINNAINDGMFYISYDLWIPRTDWKQMIRALQYTLLRYDYTVKFKEIDGNELDDKYRITIKWGKKE